MEIIAICITKKLAILCGKIFFFWQALTQADITYVSEFLFVTSTCVTLKTVPVSFKNVCNFWNFLKNKKQATWRFSLDSKYLKNCGHN